MISVCIVGLSDIVVIFLCLSWSSSSKSTASSSRDMSVSIALDGRIRFVQVVLRLHARGRELERSLRLFLPHGGI